MANEKVKLITHPMRAQIITAVSGRPLTIAQIAETLPDAPIASLYRHVRLLVDGGVLVPVDEIRVNGAATKVYGVKQGMTMITPADTADASTADHLSYFTAFTDVLNATFRSYVGQADADPNHDPVSALMTVLYLTPDECRQFLHEVHDVVRKWEAHPRSEGAIRLIAANISIPDRSDPQPS